MIPTLLVLPLLCPAPLPPALPTAHQELASESTPTERTVEDLEVLRRLLVDAIAGESTDAGFPFFTGGSGMNVLPRGHGRAVPHSRAFHLPGQGAFFSFDVSLPVAPVEGSQGNEGVTRRDEAEKEWERVRREVRTGVRSGGRGYSGSVTLFNAYVETDDREWRVDPEALTEAENAILIALGRHAGRVEGLSSSDTITVALHVSGAENGSFVMRTEPTSDEECEDNGAAVAWLGAAMAARRAPSQRVIVQVGLADLRRGELNGDPEGTRRLARIHRY